MSVFLVFTSLLIGQAVAHPPWPDPNGFACPSEALCAKSQCHDLLLQCLDDAGCMSLLSCAQSCICGDNYCAASCAMKGPSVLVMKSFQCVLVNCILIPDPAHFTPKVTNMETLPNANVPWLLAFTGVAGITLVATVWRWRARTTVEIPRALLG